MLHDGRIFDKPNNQAQLLGALKDVTPRAAVVGSNVFEQDFEVFNTSATLLHDAENITIAVDAFPLDNQGACDGVLLYMGLKFGTGSSQSGFGDKFTGPALIGSPILTNENIVDIGLGTSISLPAAFISPTIRYRAFSQAGFGVNTQAGPKYRIALSYAYTAKTNVLRASKTDLFPDVIANNASHTFIRPKYAKEISVMWLEYRTTGPVDLTFVTLQGYSIQTIRIAANTLPVPVIPWPEPAAFMVMTNSSGGNLSVFSARNLLVL